jgi:nucleoside-diphosphate-sugar epimerase
MKALLIGGTGLISRGIVKHLLARGAEITVFNRGLRDVALSPAVRTLVGDRNDFAAFENLFSNSRFDVVIDMICFKPAQAQSDVRAFANRCGHFIFCSTVCTYGVKIPPEVIVDETFPQEPVSAYGINKLACEKIFLAAHDEKKFNATVLRPASTHGPGNPLIDHLEANPVAWDRMHPSR